ncbi:hypothetical protein GGH12_005446 [Coemansia sp. RSA 1822]|nr:hypothetical protein LPJ76_005575 [Coemansia sp. RSA 638]KAJ2125031.1 hypothetical protein IW147_001161 [Coemansia sp. RSA 720]KAJ2543428.1 hypothetical protein GGF49_002033 [Coemansia sp. RSA 1853]KAJ2559334.1 hypothetical protein GGH12_005446 [Coemansia sp. RSA 1822]
MESFNVETTPLVNLLNDLLTEYTTSLRTLLDQFDTSGNRNTTASPTSTRHTTARHIVKLDHNMQQLFEELQQHQRRQHEIRRIQLQSMRSGRAQLEFITRVQEAHVELERVVVDSETKIERAQLAEKSQPRVEEIIHYANKLSKYTAAPPNYDPESGMPAEPPYPLLVAMRAGILNRYRMKKAVRAKDEDEEEEDFAHHTEAEQYDSADDDDLFLGLDLNPDL